MNAPVGQAKVVINNFFNCIDHSNFVLGNFYHYIIAKFLRKKEWKYDSTKLLDVNFISLNSIPV